MLASPRKFCTLTSPPPLVRLQDAVSQGRDRPFRTVSRDSQLCGSTKSLTPPKCPLTRGACNFRTRSLKEGAIALCAGHPLHRPGVRHGFQVLGVTVWG